MLSLPTLANLLHYWANFYHCKWPNIGHTDWDNDVFRKNSFVQFQYLKIIKLESIEIEKEFLKKVLF